MTGLTTDPDQAGALRARCPVLGPPLTDEVSSLQASYVRALISTGVLIDYQISEDVCQMTFGAPELASAQRVLARLPLVEWGVLGEVNWERVAQVQPSLGRTGTQP